MDQIFRSLQTVHLIPLALEITCQSDHFKLTNINRSASSEFCRIPMVWNLCKSFFSEFHAVERVEADCNSTIICRQRIETITWIMSVGCTIASKTYFSITVRCRSRVGIDFEVKGRELTRNTILRHSCMRERLVGDQCC